MRFSSLTSDRRASSFTDEKSKDAGAEHIDQLEVTRTESAAAAGPIDEEAWRARERRIVRKLDMTLLPTVWTLYLFKCVLLSKPHSIDFILYLTNADLSRVLQLSGPEQHRVSPPQPHPLHFARTMKH